MAGPPERTKTPRELKDVAMQKDSTKDDANQKEQTMPQEVGFFESGPGHKSSGRLNNFLAIMAGSFLIISGIALAVITTIWFKEAQAGTAITLCITIGGGLVGGGAANKSLQEKLKNGHG